MNGRSPREATLALLLAAALFPTPARPAEPARADLRSLFPNRAELFVDEPGLSRLPLPPEVLAACQADLADLRIVDRSGREVAYLVDGGPPPDTAFEELLTYRPRLLATARQTEQRESAPDLRRETYELSLPEGEPRGWDLVLETTRARFVRRFELLSVAAGRDPEAIAEGSLFRLPGRRQENMRLALPLLAADRLVLILEGEDDEFLEPAFRFEARRALAEPEALRVALEVRASRSRDGRTVVELDRPRGLVPDRLALSTATGSFNRRVEVWDEGPGAGAEPLGSGILYRLEGTAGAERLRLPLEAARGESLRVVIDDGDSPPLERLVFQAVLRRPSLVFSLAKTGGGEAAGHLLYGGARAFRPRYDLAGLLSAERRRLSGEPARVGVELRDADRLGRARLGPPEANPWWDPAPALAFAMRPGAAIAAWPFAYRRPVPVPRTDEGLLRLRLDPETVARSRPGLEDLRLVDVEGRQWPYLLDRSGTTERLPLTVAGPETRGGSSIYALGLPASPLRIRGLLVDSPAPYFDRAFELRGTLAGGGRRDRVLLQGRLVRRPEKPGEVVVDFDREPVESLELRVVDGDDPPLELSAVEARVPLPELFFAAPEGDYALLFGNPEAGRPRYELEGVRDLVLAVDATAVRAGELVESPGRGPFARFRGEGGWQQVLLWAAIILAVALLTWITLRLARQDDA